MTFAQRRNRLTTHFSGRISVVKRRMTISSPNTSGVCNITIYLIFSRHVSAWNRHHQSKDFWTKQCSGSSTVFFSVLKWNLWTPYSGKGCLNSTWIVTSWSCMCNLSFSLFCILIVYNWKWGYYYLLCFILFWPPVADALLFLMCSMHWARFWFRSCRSLHFALMCLDQGGPG
jgi:hypothetical protein